MIEFFIRREREREIERERLREKLEEIVGTPYLLRDALCLLGLCQQEGHHLLWSLDLGPEFCAKINIFSL
jgi:hypothetical protein